MAFLSKGSQAPRKVDGSGPIKSVSRNHELFDKLCHQRLFLGSKETVMATMNVSLPDPMKDWVEAQAKTGRYSNVSDYVRDLIRRDQARTHKIAQMQRFVDDGITSGLGRRSKDELFAAATELAEISRGRA
jgi:antitoxin ParD1/3/4